MEALTLSWKNTLVGRKNVALEFGIGFLADMVCSSSLKKRLRRDYHIDANHRDPRRARNGMRQALGSIGLSGSNTINPRYPRHLRDVEWKHMAGPRKSKTDRFLSVTGRSSHQYLGQESTLFRAPAAGLSPPFLKITNV